MTRLRAALIVAVAIALPLRLYADTVVPSDDVTTGVTVRASASASSSIVGMIRPGEQAELLGSVPNWHRVQLANGLQGFVSKRWTKVLASSPPAGNTDSFTIDVVDVGTGLAVLVRGADFRLVYDAGSNDDTARGSANRMVAYMKQVDPALTTIDHLILSHPHTDHVELLSDLFGEYAVRQVWDSGRVNDICGYRRFLAAVRDEAGVQYHNALFDFGQHGYSFGAKQCDTALPAETITFTHASRINEQAIPLGQNAAMTILHADGSKTSSANENTLVVRLDLGTTRILLMGDAEAGGRKSPSVAPSPGSIEGSLLACCTNDLAARILIVGHHGSLTSSRKAFLNAIGASTYVVSSGPHKYQSVVLPDADIISELSPRGEVFRTDRNDAACKTNPAKVGPDNDDQPGGCDNVRITISPNGAISVAYQQ
jgi:competence protein ComEC